MQTTYAQRLRRAIAHATISQAELARRLRNRGVQIEQQAIQYLAKEDNHARGSKHTSAIADECGVEATWLETGQGDMLSTGQARQPTATYRVDSTHAIVKAISTFNPAVRKAFIQLIGAVADAQKSSRTYELSKGEARAESAPQTKAKRIRVS